jgi:uroporphyrinogen-III decarboxylase
MEICKINSEILGDILPTITAVSAPFSMAVGLRGYEKLVMDMIEDPKYVHDLLEFCCAVTISVGNAIKSTCGVYPTLSDAWSSIPNLSPDKYYEFAFPYTKKCFQAFGED